MVPVSYEHGIPETLQFGVNYKDNAKRERALSSKQKVDKDPGKKKPSSSILGAYEQHLSALKRYVMRILHVENDVDDVVQEAFLRAYKAEGAADIRQPKSYLFRVAKHVALGQIRQKVNRPTDYIEDSDLTSILTGESTLEDEMLAQERLGIHCMAVAALPPRRRKVYLMRKVYGMSQKDIAEILGITVSTVEAHLAKAFKECHLHVKARLAEEGGDVVRPSSERGI